jgi:hypothetical protein
MGFACPIDHQLCQGEKRRELRTFFPTMTVLIDYFPGTGTVFRGNNGMMSAFYTAKLSLYRSKASFAVTAV